ncbi:hypothetical protein C1T17_09835 [Sphingobium sp. SCG-1]|nr:hypothetical protein C1T17_09835 [Sphingobium sp. SCG-1]
MPLGEEEGNPAGRRDAKKAAKNENANEKGWPRICATTPSSPTDKIHQAASGWPFFAKRRRATSAAAAAPNNSTIGGAGTSVPPVLPP